MTPLGRLARDLAALDRLMNLDGRLTVLSFPVRRPARAPRASELPSALVERVARMGTTTRRTA